MTDTLWSDVSEFQTYVDDSYPYEVLCIRSNDGTYLDHHFQANFAWAKGALASGKLKLLIIYLVYRPNWLDDLNALKNNVGEVPDGVIFMLDVESWGNEIGGDNSNAINSLYWGITDWLGTSQESGTRRVIGYGNTWDLNNIWPTKPPGIALVVAGYGANPGYPGKVAHQFTDGVYGGPLYVPPFGYADVNSADGYDIDALLEAVGVGTVALSQDDINAIVNGVTKWLSDFIVGYVGPIGSDVKDVREQLTGSRNTIYNADGSVNTAQSFPGWAQLGHRTLTDAVAAGAARVGVPGAADPTPPATPTPPAAA